MTPQKQSDADSEQKRQYVIDRPELFSEHCIKLARDLGNDDFWPVLTHEMKILNEGRSAATGKTVDNEELERLMSQ